MPGNRTADRPVAAVWLRRVDGAATLATLLCPLFLLHGRGIAEALIDLVAVLFLVRSSLSGDWAWAQRAWVVAAAVWWGWLVVCSIPFGPFGAGGSAALLQAVATARFLLFAAALQHVTLADPRARRIAGWLLAGSCLYIAAQLLLQAVTGHNLFGVPRFHDGTLTGPYDHPRAAAPLSRLLLPTMLPASAWILLRPRLAGRPVARAAAALLPLLLGLALIVLAGQRMPTLLTGLGLVVAGLMLKRLRLPLLAALLAVPVLVGLSALATPRSFQHLVVLFGEQMAHFGRSLYGLIYTRALSIASANPLTGLGFDGFRHGCADPAYFRDWPPFGASVGEGGGAAICVQHAHNHYLQALTDAGIPGLALFCALVLAWLAAATAGLGRIRDRPVRQAWRVGLFAALFIHEWPIASSSAFTNMPLGGWFFLLLGLALAEARADMAAGADAGAARPLPHMQPRHTYEADHV